MYEKEHEEVFGGGCGDERAAAADRVCGAWFFGEQLASGRSGCKRAI